MSRKIATKIGAILFSAAFTALVVPGCTLRLGQGDGDGKDDTRPAPNETQPEPPDGGASGDSRNDLTPEEEAAEAFAQINPQQLALAEAKAALTTAYLVATVESSGMDPSTLDGSALEQLMEQYLPAAAAEADAWLATLDPSTLPTSYQARYECTEEHGCPYVTKCKYNPPTADHNCWVTDCGKSRCSLCPDWVLDLLKSLVLTSWCAYVCTENIAARSNNVVAIGAGGISTFKGFFVGPICKAP